MTEVHGDHNDHDGELDAQVLAPLYSSADRRFRKWEDVVSDSVACNYKDHPVTCRDESDITAVELAALHHELAWTHCVGLLTSRWKNAGIRRMTHVSCCKGDPDLVHRWYVRPIEFCRAAMEELARS